MLKDQRILWLIIIIMVAVTVSTAVAIKVLYDTAFEQERLHLLQNVDDQAHLMEAVAWMDRLHHPLAEAVAPDDALSQVQRAFERYPSDEQIAEITVARRVGDAMEYLVIHGRVTEDEMRPIAFGSPLGEPMQRALSGRSGAMIGRDYRGVRVLAAYQPVPLLAAGVVAKMDLAEIRAPFVRGGLMVIGLALALIAVGAALLVRLTSPIVRHLTETGMTLERREQELALIMASTGEGIFGIDSQGACSFINRAALAMLGYADEHALLRQDMHARIHHSRGDGTPLAPEDCPIHQARTGDSVIRRDDETLWRADGTSFPAELRAYPMLREGVRVGTVVTFQDITERKEREAQHLHAQKLELLGQLTGGIAHDFNNLLTIILVNLRLLTAREELCADPDVRELLGDALSATEDGAELTERLLNFSRRQQTEPRRADLRRLLTDCQGLLRRTTREGIELRIRPGPIALPVQVDAQQFQNALLNLAINACDAMPRGGVLTIAAVRRRLPAAAVHVQPALAPGPYVVLSLSDTGAGMTTEAVARAVEPFYTTKPPGAGSGLGLSMVYRFVQQAGGGLGIDSAPGAGTRVFIVLPECADAAPEPAVAESAADAPAVAPAATVLVVDDETRVRRSATRVLRELGYKVLEAEDAAAAKRLLRGGARVDLLFTDIVMPGPADGRDLGRWARRERPGLKVLLTSGFTEAAETAPEEDTDACAFLAKPYTKAGLQAAMRRLG